MEIFYLYQCSYNFLYISNQGTHVLACTSHFAIVNCIWSRLLHVPSPSQGFASPTAADTISFLHNWPWSTSDKFSPPKWDTCIPKQSWQFRPYNACRTNHSQMQLKTLEITLPPCAISEPVANYTFCGSVKTSRTSPRPASTCSVCQNAEEGIFGCYKIQLNIFVARINRGIINFKEASFEHSLLMKSIPRLITVCDGVQTAES